MPLSRNTAPPSQIRHVPDLAGPQGPLEAILNTGAPDAPFSALVCHPYPPAGGSLHNKVVYHATKALTALGIPTLRFNFRGVGRSAGTFDHGEGEQQDVLAALSWLERELTLPTLLVGFSFGSYVGLRATCTAPRVLARVALGLPIRPIAGRNYTFDFLHTCPGPILFASGDHDEFCPVPALEDFVTTLPMRHQVSIIPEADHFFAGILDSPETKLPQMQQVLKEWLLQEFRPTI